MTALANGESVDLDCPIGSSHMKDGRGNIVPSTIILPTIAMEVKKKSEKDGTESSLIENFMIALEKVIDECKDGMIERFDWICSQDPSSAQFMYNNKTFYYYNDDFEKEGIRGVLKHGTLALGQIGLAECLQILIGCDHTTEKGMNLAKEIESLFQKKCKEFKAEVHTIPYTDEDVVKEMQILWKEKHEEELPKFDISKEMMSSEIGEIYNKAVENVKRHNTYHLNFGVYYTPAESLCGTAMKKFQKKYGKIPNVSEKEFFTNSIHVPVWKEMSPFEKIDIESQLTGYSIAGCITYVEIGDNAINNLDALEQIVLYAKEKDVPYFALNVKLSECTQCGYNGYVNPNENCPSCGADHETYVNDFARITGYLSTTISHFNDAKKAEYKDRYTHVNKIAGWNKGKA